MSRSLALALVFVFLTAWSVVAVYPVFGATEAENTSGSKASLQTARGNLGVAPANGKIYAIGGTTEFEIQTPYQSSGGIVGTNEEYDPATNKWTYKSRMLTPRMDFAIASYLNKIYCIGGVTGSGTSGINEVYDSETDSWETKTPMPSDLDSLDWLQANVVNGKIYLLGAYFSVGYSDPYNSSAPFKVLNNVYDPATDTWMAKAYMPTADVPYVSASIDKKIYVIGQRIVQVYDTQTDEWSQGPLVSPLNGRYEMAVATTGLFAPKQVYALGLPKYDLAGKFLGEGIQAYDPEKESWRTAASLPTERYAFGAAVLGDMIYVVGGRFFFEYQYMQGEEPRDTVEQYTPFGYGNAPPIVSVALSENNRYTSSEVSISFTVNKPVVWMSYSLDGKDNLTITGDITLAGLSNGSHNITIYAKDTSGNIGASETTTFTIALETFPIIPVVAASVVAIAACAGLLVYFKKNTRKPS